MLRSLFGAKETPEEWEAKVVKASGELSARLGAPGDGDVQDDAFLRRFVVANEFDVAKAADHVRQEREWRAKTLPITLTAKEEEVYSSGRIRFLGVNHEGHAILCYDFMWGKFLEGFSADEIIRAQINLAETCIATMQEVAPDGPGQWIVVCLGGPPPGAWTKPATAVMERNYPERLHRSIIYPVPQIVKRLVDAIIYLLPKRTKAKFCVVGTEDDLRRLTGIPVGGRLELPDDMLGGIEGARERAAAAGRAETIMRDGEAPDMSMMDAETQKDLEQQAETDPELRQLLQGA